MATDAIVFLEQLRFITRSNSESRTEPYIWPALIRVDDNTLVTPELVDIVAPVQGNARIVIKENMRVGETAAIPSSVGILRTRFEDDLTTRILILVVALLEMDETPASAMKAGFQAFNRELHDAIADNLFALDAADKIEDEEQKEAEKERIVEDIKKRVEGRVKSAIENGLSGWEKAQVFAGTLNLDDPLGSAFITLGKNFIVPGPFTLGFEARGKILGVIETFSKYEIRGQLQLRPVIIERCQAQINAVNAAQDVVNGIEAEISDLQAQLSGGGDESPLPKEFILAEIARVREELIPAVEALREARAALGFCRSRQGVVGGPGDVVATA